MPAMPKETSTHLPSANFSDITLKEQLKVKRGISPNITKVTTEEKNMDGQSISSIQLVPTETVLTPKIQPNNCGKYIDDSKPEPLNTLKTQQNVSQNNNTIIKSVATPMTPSQSSLAVNKTSKKSPNDFIFGKFIGEGSFSTVYLAREVITRREFASKLNLNTCG